jgi:hypothetical protein
MIQKELKEQGYTKEEEYFYNLNKTLIRKSARSLVNNSTSGKMANSRTCIG